MKNKEKYYCKLHSFIGTEQESKDCPDCKPKKDNKTTEGWERESRKEIAAILQSLYMVREHFPMENIIPRTVDKLSKLIATERQKVYEQAYENAYEAVAKRFRVREDELLKVERQKESGLVEKVKRKIGNILDQKITNKDWEKIRDVFWKLLKI